jgi:beta-lactamase class A
MNTRRNVLASLAAGAAFASDSTLAQGKESHHGGVPDCESLAGEIKSIFQKFPDRIAFKVFAPATHDAPAFSVASQQDVKLFTASTNKSYILCERLRQVDSPDVDETLAEHHLLLNEDIYSPGSDILNPPNLSGIISERTAMEAMVVHSDNTGTDMVLREAKVANVRKFVSSIGLKNTVIPDSTRAFAGYLLGAPNYLTITWDEIEALGHQRPVNPFLNDVETLASSSADLVSFFSRALQGEFFTHRETLEEFRRILALGDINYLVRFPLGISAFGKAGYADLDGSHARSIAGGMYFPNRWVYFSFILNWDAPEGSDPKTVEAFYLGIRHTAWLLRDRLGS